MISTCPECGKSYPTHHGLVCKVCVSKKSSSAAIKPAVVVKEELKPVPDTDQKPIQQPAAQQSSSFDDFNPSLGMYGGIPSHPDSSPAGNESVIKKKPCKHCFYENNADDVFCASCKKMLESIDFTNQADYPLSEIKGSQALHLTKLKELGVTTTSKLLEQGANPVKRKTLLIKSKISETFIMRMLNQSDLLRVPGLEPDHAFMLEIIGINSVKSLERKKVSEILSLANKSRAMLISKGVYVIPDEKLMTNWVESVKTINKIVS